MSKTRIDKRMKNVVGYIDMGYRKADSVQWLKQLIREWADEITPILDGIERLGRSTK